MTRYEIEQQLYRLQKDLDIANDCDEQAACRLFNVESKSEIIETLSKEISAYEDLLEEMESFKNRQINYERTADLPFICW